MLTGLVYAAILLLWAVVLVPHWLQRHDRRAEHRSAERFRRAMQSLNRHQLRGGQDAASSNPTVEYAGASRSRPVPHASQARPAGQARGLAAQRRRRTALFLATSALIAGAASVAGFAPPWLPVAVLLALGTFLALGAWTVNRRRSTGVAADSQPGRARAPKPAASPSVPDAASTDGTWQAVEPVVPHYVRITEQAKAEAGQGTSGRDWTAVRMLEQAEALKAERRDLVAEVGLDDYVDVRPASGRPGGTTRVGATEVEQRRAS